MKAVAVTPGKQDSQSLVEQPQPVPEEKETLLRVLRVGVCGTDRDIIAGFYGEAPPGEGRLVIGHESLCRVEEAGGSGFGKGDLVVPTVRRPCPERCLNCANGESDMCLTGHYSEHGIKGLHGFAREFAATDSLFLTRLPESLVEVGVLLEPLTVAEKGIFQAYVMQQSRMKWEPRKALVLGAGPVGLLATALLRLMGLEVHTAATRPNESLKAKLVGQLGAGYVNVKEEPLNQVEHRFDLVLEVTGSSWVALEAQNLTSQNGVVSFLGIYREQTATEDAGRIFTNLVLGNRVYFGSVNANRNYFDMGAKDLVRIESRWPGFLGSLITRRVGVEDFQQAYEPESEEEVKTVLEFGHRSGIGMEA